MLIKTGTNCGELLPTSCAISNPSLRKARYLERVFEQFAFSVCYREKRAPLTARSLARSCVALMRLIVPERERVTSDSVVAPPAWG
jgi:hypothetical protein